MCVQDTSLPLSWIKKDFTHLRNGSTFGISIIIYAGGGGAGAGARNVIEELNDPRIVALLGVVDVQEVHPRPVGIVRNGVIKDDAVGHEVCCEG